MPLLAKRPANLRARRRAATTIWSPWSSKSTSSPGLDTSELGSTWTEICAYGTAVRVRQL
jgi:hypothetical protein